MRKKFIYLCMIGLLFTACNDSSGHVVDDCAEGICREYPSTPVAVPDSPVPVQPTPENPGDPQTTQPEPGESANPGTSSSDPQTTQPEPASPGTTPGDPQTTQPDTPVIPDVPDAPPQIDPKPATPQPIDPIVTEERCNEENKMRCHNDVWHGYIERCVGGFWQKEQTCGEYSCMNDKECGECLGGTRTCQNDIMTWCQNGKQYHKKCNRCLGSGNICEYFDHEEFCQELTPGYGIEYIGDVWYTPYVCEGPCNEDGTACAQGYHCQDGESYCFDDGYIIGSGAESIQQMTCVNGEWKYERCVMGCNADHTSCKEIEDINDYRCSDNDDGTKRHECYEENGISYERSCDNGFWSPPVPCDTRCRNDHQYCLTAFTGGCSEEGKKICKNDSESHQYGAIWTCLNGEWTQTQSCGARSCEGDHCGDCTNFVSTCIDGSEFIYCHNGHEFHVSCACNASSCLSCPYDDTSTFCFDRTFGNGTLYSCENGVLQSKDCDFHGSTPYSCNAEGTACRL